MSKSQFVVTSEVHGDFAGFGCVAAARACAHRLNSRLFGELVYFPLVEREFVVTLAEETRLNRRYQAEEYLVVETHE